MTLTDHVMQAVLIAAEDRKARALSVRTGEAPTLDAETGGEEVGK